MPPPGRVSGSTVLGLVLVLSLVGTLAFGMFGVGNGDRPAPRAQVVAFQPPVHLPAGDEYVRSRVLPTGDLAVEHWVRARTMITRITLTVPSVPGLDPGRVVARDVELQVDGLDVQVPRTVWQDSDAEVLTAAHRVHISYVLSGVLQRSPAGSARALARVTTLDLSTIPDTEQRAVSVTGARVLSMACTAPSPAAVPRPCGERRALGWRVDLGTDDHEDVVMAQLDLP
jgi:hypothetical protein